MKELIVTVLVVVSLVLGVAVGVGAVASCVPRGECDLDNHEVSPAASVGKGSGLPERNVGSFCYSGYLFLYGYGQSAIGAYHIMQPMRASSYSDAAVPIKCNW